MIHVPGRPSRKRRRKSLFAALNVTSLADMLTVLVVFALLDYNPPGELLA
jgi:hypothetical protein